MTEQNKTDGQMVRGQVKWFDPAKGFGFILSDAGGPDILLHANVLRNFGQSSVADGSGIEVFAVQSDRGMQAVEVVSVSPPAASVGLPLGDLADIDPQLILNLPILPARVKWFDKGKGFGFANVFATSDDIFVHIEVLRRSGLADLQPGEAICLKVIDGKRGKMAIEVQAWEMAVSNTPP